MLFDESLCQQGKNFSNKVWNSFRLISSWTVSDDLNQSEYSKVGIEWFDQKFNLKLIEIEDHFDKYRISDALMTIYKLVWDDLCSINTLQIDWGIVMTQIYSRFMYKSFH